MAGYSQVSDFADLDTASVLMNDYVAKNTIGNEEARIKHIEINPASENVKDVIKHRKEESKKFRWDYATILESFDKLKSDIYVEMIPSVRISEKTPFLDVLKSTYKAFGADVDMHEDYLDPIKVDVPDLHIEPVTLDSISSGILMRDKDRLYFEYDKKNNKSIGFVTIAERENNKNEFQYPKFKKYSAPTLLFNLFEDGSEFHFDVLKKLHARMRYGSAGI